MKLIIDCAGGDNGYKATVGGALTALAKHDDLSVVLIGDEREIEKELSGKDFDTRRVSTVHAPGVITGNDKPTDAIRLKKDSSMIKSISMLREEQEIDGMISTGATGAIVAAATLRIGRVRGIRRPAFCPLLPTMNGGIVGICDSGANTDVTPEMLLQYALMGTLYLKNVYGVERPRTALLNVGVEEEKGDDLHKEGYRLLKNCPDLCFVGNMEGRDLLSGKYDLVVADGFSGNVLCKTTEGTALQLLKKLKTDICSKKKYKFGALFMRKMFMEEKEFMNYQNYGGSVLLGVEKTVVKGHGSSDAKAVAVCIDQAYTIKKSDMNGQLSGILERMTKD
ncbi:MAG: phosphate acyltransferase PlsX [Clostridia bacterium]|nr:phosphate acyltransferase PlsX [Clostridia bacterium]